MISTASVETMDGICDFIKDCANVYVRLNLKEDCDGFNVSEIWNTNGFSELRASYISDPFVKSWLKGKVPDTADDGLGPVLRLVWVDMLIESVPWKLAMSKDNFDAILDKFNVDLLHGSVFTGPAVFNLLPAKPLGVGNNRHHCSVFVPDLLTVAWTYELPTTKTQALCWAQEDILVALQDILDHQKALFRHPMTLALVAVMMLGRLVDHDLNQEEACIQEVANQTQCVR